MDAATEAACNALDVRAATERADWEGIDTRDGATLADKQKMLASAAETGRQCMAVLRGASMEDRAEVHGRLRSALQSTLDDLTAKGVYRATRTAVANGNR